MGDPVKETVGSELALAVLETVGRLDTVLVVVCFVDVLVEETTVSVLLLDVFEVVGILDTALVAVGIFDDPM